PASSGGGWVRSSFSTCTRLATGSGGTGGAEGVRREELRGAGLVELVAFEDLEACVGEQVGDRSREVTAAEQPLLHWFETVLPTLHLVVGSETVLDEVQSPAGLQDSAELCQRGGDVRNCAHRPGRQRCVLAV